MLAIIEDSIIDFCKKLNKLSQTALLGHQDTYQQPIYQQRPYQDSD